MSNFKPIEDKMVNLVDQLDSAMTIINDAQLVLETYHQLTETKSFDDNYEAIVEKKELFGELFDRLEDLQYNFIEED